MPEMPEMPEMSEMPEMPWASDPDKFRWFEHPTQSKQTANRLQQRLEQHMKVFYKE